MEKWQWRHNLLKWRVFLFLFSSLVTVPSFLSMPSLVLEFWQFTFIRDWPEIRKSKKPLSELCPIYGHWGELRIPRLARMSLIKWYWMLQNTRVTAFFISELLRENQQVDKSPLPSSTQIRVNKPLHVVH